MKMFFLLIFILPSSAQDYFYCVEGGGQQIYSDKPCGASSQIRRVHNAQSVSNEYGAPDSIELNRRLNEMIFNDAKHRRLQQLHHHVTVLTNEMNEKISSLHKNNLSSAVQSQAVATQYAARLQSAQADIDRLSQSR